MRDLIQQAAGRFNLAGELAFFGQPILAETLGIGFKGEVTFHNNHAFARFANAKDFNGEGKAVQKLGAQVAFFGVHGADKDKARRVGEGDAFTLNDVHAHGGRIEQHVHDMIIQQVDFIYVQQAAVCSRQNTGIKTALALLNSFFNVEGTNHTVFSCRDRQVDKRGPPGGDGQRFTPGYAFTTFGTPGVGGFGIAAKAAIANDVDFG